MSIHIETLIFCDLIIEDFKEHNLNDLFFKINTKMKHDKIDVFERRNN